MAKVCFIINKMRQVKPELVSVVLHKDLLTKSWRHVEQVCMGMFNS